MSKRKFSFAEKTNVTSRTIELVRCEQRLLDACQGEDTSMPCFLVHSFEEVIHNYNKTPFTRTKKIGTACQIFGSVPHLPVPRQPPGGSLGTPKFLSTVATLHLRPIHLHVENWECCVLKIISTVPKIWRAVPIFLVCVNWVQDIGGAFFSLEASYESKLYVIKIPNNNVVDAQACIAELTELESMTEDQVKSLINSCLPKTCI